MIQKALAVALHAVALLQSLIIGTLAFVRSTARCAVLLLRIEGAPWWIPVGVAACLITVMDTAGDLLASINAQGQRSFGASSFTGFHSTFWDTTELKDAFGLWLAGDDGTARVLVLAHVGADLLFIPLYAFFFAWALKRAGVRRALAIGGPVAVAILDAIETVAAGTMLAHWARTGDVVPTIVQAAGFGKWVIGVSVALVGFGPALFHGIRGLVVGLRRAGRSGAASRVGLEEGGRGFVGQTIVVAILVAVLALPIGGPLDQVPEVIRYEVTAGTWAPALAGSLLAIGLIVLACVVGGREPASVPRELPHGLVLLIAAWWSIALVVHGAISGDGLWAPGLAPFIVAVAITGAAGLARLGGVGDDRPEVEGPGLQRGGVRALTPRDVRWICILGTALFAALMIAAFRAAVPAILIDGGGADLHLRWTAAIGFAGATLIASYVQLLLTSVVGRARAGGRERRPSAVMGDLFFWSSVLGWAVTLGVAAWWIVAPYEARWAGATGSLLMCFAIVSMAVAALQFASRRWPRWSATRTLWLGSRTPWSLMLVLIFLVASTLNTDGRYHDARVVEGASQPTHPSLEAAFGLWAERQDSCRTAGQRAPLVIVAAPGGGARAAYWTARAMEGLFDTPCKVSSVFSVSGASGGSVGATVWLASESPQAPDGSRSDTPASEHVRDMVREDAIAGTFAALILRDLIQPLTGRSRPWPDRAAVLEDGWLRSASVLGTPESPLLWSDLGGALEWRPVMALHGSSVTDGCLVLLTNVAGLPASSGGDCLAAAAGTGRIAASIAPLESLIHGSAASECTDGFPAAAVPRAVTVALLSARFPYVTPSGALYRCGRTSAAEPGKVDRTYVVDGGYFENSGLLTAIQILEALDERIDRRRWDPWILLLDNHYRTREQAAPEPTPKELWLPLSTKGGDRLVSQAALEQAAAVATRNAGGTCTSFGVVAPSRKPRTEAPLGWVLSDDIITSLNKDLDEAISALSKPSRPGCPSFPATLAAGLEG